MKITFLGVGSGGTLNLYNTCFVIENNKGPFLIDAGGSIEIIRKLRMANIELKDIKNIFISHSHTDHILGLIWMYKKIGVMVMHGDIKGKINVYCNDVVYEAIKGVSRYVLPDKLNEILDQTINYIIVNDGDTFNIEGVDYTFFDTLAKDTKQFGFSFECNGKHMIYLGDETIKPAMYERVRNADYVMHEAMCLDSEEEIFHAYEKNHLTALSTAKVMNELNVKNVILYHTEDNLGDERKEAYTKEAKEVFKGNVIVPDELEVIQL